MKKKEICRLFFWINEKKSNQSTNQTNDHDTICLFTYLKGKKPDMTIWIGKVRYQGIGGISRGASLVRQGASKLPAERFPVIPPIMANGVPTERGVKKNKINS